MRTAMSLKQNTQKPAWENAMLVSLCSDYVISFDRNYGFNEIALGAEHPVYNRRLRP